MQFRWERAFTPKKLVDYGKDKKAISLSDQQTRVWGRLVPVRHKRTIVLPVE